MSESDCLYINMVEFGGKACDPGPVFTEDDTRHAREWIDLCNQYPLLVGREVRRYRKYLFEAGLI